jgi:hypothetical protein
MDKITGVLNALQGIYGKGFVLAGFLPICFLLGVSWFLGCCLSPAFVDFSAYLLGAKLLQQFAIGALTLFVVSIISFVFWQLNSWFRQVLEGRVLPRIVQDWLSVGERKHYESLEKKLVDYRNEAFEFRRAKAQWEAKLLAISTGTGKEIKDTQLDGKFQQLKQQTEGWRTPKFKPFDEFYGFLAKELAQTSASDVAKLEEMRDAFSGPLIGTGCALAERDLFRKIAERNSSYPTDQMSIGPSRLANVQEAQRDALVQSYGVDIAVFWSSLQKIATTDDKFAAILENSKTRLDFSVALAAVAATFTLGWLLVYGFFGSSWFIYLIGAISAVFATVIARQLVLLNYQSFGETVRTTVELFRFELLKSMHIPLPQDSDAEKQTWTWLAERLQVGNQNRVTYAQEVPASHA